MTSTESDMMLTGLCPRCKLRRILVRITTPTGQQLRVRTHECGSRLEPRDITPLFQMFENERVTTHAR